MVAVVVVVVVVVVGVGMAAVLVLVLVFTHLEVGRRVYRRWRYLATVANHGGDWTVVIGW